MRESPTLLKTPSKPQRPTFSITPSKPTPLNFGRAKEQKVTATPLKISASVTSDDVPRRLTASITQQRVDEVGPENPPDDIYATLGWDDDLDDD